jgi:sirohydrochlorin ferrochelatase
LKKWLIDKQKILNIETHFHYRSVYLSDSSKTIIYQSHYQPEDTLEALLLVAHGSRNENANQEVRELAARIAKHSTNEFETVVPAFLEFAEPGIGKGVDSCVELGAKKITVVPYFLSAGAHVNRDVPGQLEIANQRYPEIEFHLTRHFGAADGIVESVIDCAVR